MLLIIPWRGWAPRILARCCSTGASRRFFYLANSAAGRSMALVLFELPGRCTSAPAAGERAGVLCVVLSLRHFGPAAMLLIIPWRGWAPRILARCCSTGASRRFFYLGNSAAGRSMALVLFELPGRCTSAPAASERAGGLCVVLSLRHFGPAAMLLIIPWRGWAPRILARCCSTGASRRFFY